ncbi:MAG: DUF4446 family protein [Lachnospiraceae bacterium]|nr:DUF4446 family protein [Lachnospiraceae bacterium]
MDTWESIKNGLTTIAPYVALGAAVIAVALLILVIVLLVKNRRMSRRLDLFVENANGATLEDRLERVMDDNQKVKIQLRNNMNAIVKLNDEMLTAYRKIGIVKFNAFPGMAGKMSSSICLLNNENNGLIVNTIHGQEGCHTYVKEIMNGKSITALTEEDEEALKKAMDMQI